MRFMVLVKADKDWRRASCRREAAGRHGGTTRAGRGRDARWRRAPSELERRASDSRFQAHGHRWALSETKELIAGFSSSGEVKEEATNGSSARIRSRPGIEIEIRQVFQAGDFGDAFTPELSRTCGRQAAANAKR
jgi:hypothetical protein